MNIRKIEMDKEELIGKLQMVYIGDRNALNELIGYYDGLKEVIETVKQENQVLKRNCNIGNENLSFYIQENKELHNKIDKAIDFIDIYTNGINLEAFDCLKLMYKIKDLLKDSDVDE